MAIEVNGVTLPDIPAGVVDTYPYVNVVEIDYSGTLTYTLFATKSEGILVPASITGDTAMLVPDGVITDGITYELTDGAWTLTNELTEEDMSLPLGEIATEAMSFNLIYTNYTVYIVTSYNADTSTVVKGSEIYVPGTELPESRLEVGDLSFPVIPKQYFGSYPYAVLSKIITYYKGAEIRTIYYLHLASEPMFCILSGTHDLNYTFDMVTSWGRGGVEYEYDPDNDVWVFKEESTSTLVVQSGAHTLSETFTSDGVLLWSNYNIQVYEEDETLGETYFAGEGVITPVDTYPIKRTTLIKFAAHIRRISGTTDTLTPVQMINRMNSADFTLQEKSVTPSDTEQEIVPDDGYYGLSKVTVEPSTGLVLAANERIYQVGTVETCTEVPLYYESIITGGV